MAGKRQPLSLWLILPKRHGFSWVIQFDRVRRHLVVVGKLRLEYDSSWWFSQALSDSVSKKRLESRERHNRQAVGLS